MVGARVVEVVVGASVVDVVVVEVDVDVDDSTGASATGSLASQAVSRRMPARTKLDLLKRPLRKHKSPVLDICGFILAKT